MTAKIRQEMTAYEREALYKFLTIEVDAAESPVEFGPVMTAREWQAIERVRARIGAKLVNAAEPESADEGAPPAYGAGDDCRSCGMPARDCGHVRPETPDRVDQVAPVPDGKPVVRDRDGKIVNVGDIVTDFRGDAMIFGGFSRYGGTGTPKVIARWPEDHSVYGGTEYYASVFDLTVEHPGEAREAGTNA